MIIAEHVSKRYMTTHGLGRKVLDDVSFTIPDKVNVGLVGRNGAGKSTLLRLIGGVDQPSTGSIVRTSRVSWPLGLATGLPDALTGRQAAKFICRVHGEESTMEERLQFMQEFAEIGDAFDEPTRTYSSGMRSRLNFAMSLAFDFDVYLVDEITAVGDAQFRKKSTQAFKALAERSGIIMVSHSDATLREFCQSGMFVHEGRVFWFENLEDALKEYQRTQE